MTRDAIPDTGIETTSTYLDAYGPPHDRLDVIQRIMLALDNAYTKTVPEEMLANWRALASLGQTQTFEHNNDRITGEVIDLEPDHGLIVRRDTGEIVTLPASTTSVVK